MLTPRGEAILQRERAKASWLPYLEEPVYERAVRAWARAEAMLEMYGEYLEQQTAEVMSTEFGEAEEDIIGDGEKSGNSMRRARTRKTGPAWRCGGSSTLRRACAGPSCVLTRWPGPARSGRRCRVSVRAIYSGLPSLGRRR